MNKVKSQNSFFLRKFSHAWGNHFYKEISYHRYCICMFFFNVYSLMYFENYWHKNRLFHNIHICILSSSLLCGSWCVFEDGIYSKMFSHNADTDNLIWLELQDFSFGESWNFSGIETLEQIKKSHSNFFYPEWIFSCLMESLL